MKKLVMLVMVLVAAFTLSACGGNDAEDTVRFGVIGPLSGDYTEYGDAVKNGANLAAKHLNADGGVLGLDVEVFAEDSEGDPEKGVNAYNKLVEQNEVHALVGGTFSGVTLGIKDLAVADGIPVLSPTATHADVTLDAANVFRACYTDAYQGEVAAVFANDSLSATKAAVFYNSGDAYSTGLADAFIAKFGELGEVAITQTYAKADTDFVAQISAIKDAGVDVVFVPGYVAEVGPILQEAAAQNLEAVFLGGDGWDSIEIDYAAVAEGFFFANHYAKSDEAAAVQDFVSAYTEEYGSAPNALAALAYDAVMALAEAMEAAGSTDNADVVAALAALDYQDAVTGSIKFDAQGDPIKAVSMIKLVDGEHVLEAKVAAE